MEYYSAIKRDKILTSATTWIGLESIMLSIISQAEKDKYYIISLILEFKKQEKERQKTILLTRENKLTGAACGGIGEIAEGDQEYTYHDGH